ncbi:MAG: PH domain-containing protein [Cypionkella sp.]
MTEAPSPIADGNEERGLTPLHPNYITLLRLRTAIAAVPFAIGALVLEGAADRLPGGVLIGPVLVLAALAIARVPLRRHAARGYDLAADRLRVVRGLWFRSDTVVPLGRVQHIDIDQGALERGLGLATLTVHTAGTHNASVSLPGLAAAEAEAMRETIAAHIKRELL